MLFFAAIQGEKNWDKRVTLFIAVFLFINNQKNKNTEKHFVKQDFQSNKVNNIFLLYSNYHHVV